MTSKTTTLTKTERDFEPFPSHPPRDDMQNWIHLYDRGKAYSLVLHIGDPETTTAWSEIPVGPTLTNRQDHRVPDFTVSKNSKPWLIEEDGGYAIDRQGKPPDFVLEVASRWTGVVDYTEKREIYARYGIAEYWRFDSTNGEYHDVALAGDRLGDGQYEPIEVEWLDESRCRGYSDALALYICWEYGELRFYDPVSRSYLRTYDEEIAERRAEYARAEREAAARRMAEEARREAEARAAEAEAEIRRLRERLAESGDAE
ncbi:MAG: Uma2 family endonuclease [Dehalococcoidia bacterium]|nr:Uma2 family endonuclease [Dehalococcoidia bacterium]